MGKDKYQREKVERGLQGIQGVRGIQGEPGNNALNSISGREFLFLKLVFGLAMLVIVLLTTMVMLAAFYPFKTIDIDEPIKVMNPGLRVPLNGIIEIEVTGEQFTSETGTVIFTMVRIINGELVPIDSVTWVCANKIGKFKLKRFFAVRSNHLALGSDCWIQVAIRYNMYGFRPILREFSSQKFEVYKP